MKGKKNLGVTFNFDKQDFIDFTKNDNVQGLRSKFIKVVLDPLFFGQKNYEELLFYQLVKGNLKVNLEKPHFLMIPISENGPDMASVHKFWYFLLVTYSFSLKHSSFSTKLYIQDF